MKFRRALVAPIVLAAGLAAAQPAGASAPSAAHASGSPPPPPLPSLVSTRIRRVERALDRLTDDVNDNDKVHAPKQSKIVRRQLWAAWRGARYYVRHAPAPPAEDARLHARRAGVRVRDLAPKVRATIAQDDEGPVIADPVTTAMGVFDEFHSVTATIVELTDGARVPLLDAMSRTLFLSLDRRDRAVNDVHTLAPPPPVEAARVRARISQDDALPVFDTTMPTLPVFLDDEIQHIDGLLEDAADLRPGGRRILTKARAQITQTEALVNSFWPPVVDD
jgi:hypothetical protein